MTTELPCPACKQPLEYSDSYLYCAKGRCLSTEANDGVHVSVPLEVFKGNALYHPVVSAAMDILKRRVDEEERV